MCSSRLSRIPGFRYVEVRERRTASDYAQFMQPLLTQHYPEAQGTVAKFTDYTIS